GRAPSIAVALAAGALAAAALTAACGGSHGDDDTGDSTGDAAIDDAAASDGAAADAAATDGPANDARPVDAPVDAMPDAPATTMNHVHIQVSNTCAMTVTPPSIDVPADQTAYFDWHNHSVDYAVDVWMSYGGGYLDLATGATWHEPIGHCATPLAHDEYADISTACSSFRFLIHCH
ncbi:MAG TPA: hypothetical protein VHE35_26835, partial [Kofleriaceae bacterium]|nr:hypothetical protein [Kofleriaceae bacterium]